MKDKRLDNQIFVCPVCKSEGIFSSLQKAQQHISEFHQLPLDIGSSSNKNIILIIAISYIYSIVTTWETIRNVFNQK